LLVFTEGGGKDKSRSFAPLTPRSKSERVAPDALRSG